jgi:hypothetical protein
MRLIDRIEIMYRDQCVIIGKRMSSIGIRNRRVEHKVFFVFSLRRRILKGTCATIDQETTTSTPPPSSPPPPPPTTTTTTTSNRKKPRRRRRRRKKNGSQKKKRSRYRIEMRRLFMLESEIERERERNASPENNRLRFIYMIIG